MNKIRRNRGSEVKRHLGDGSVVTEAGHQEAKQNVSQKSSYGLAETLSLDKAFQRKLSKQTKKIKKNLQDGSITLRPSHKEIKQKLEEKRGLIYVGHIPHGFYEEEMRNYFKQFGKVTNVKVCRSRITGNSKGYGYVEFEHPEVAKIAAETMDNYIMFKKRIVTEYLPYEKRPKGLFHGKSSTPEHTSAQNKRGKQKYSRNKIQDDKTVAKKSKKSLKKLQSKMEKLKNLGIQCDLVPVISDKSVSEIKLEKKSSTEVSSSGSTLYGSGTTFKKPKEKKNQSKSLASDATASGKASYKSLTAIKSNKAMLTKSLDSVKTLLNKHSANSQDGETQTCQGRIFKKDKVGRNLRRGGIVKVKKEKTLTLNKDTVKKIARELIRKRGKPLLSLGSTKLNGRAKNK